MRFIRRSLMAASYVLVFLGSAQAQSITIGSTTVWSAGDGGNGNLLLAQVAKLSQAATIQSLSFYVTTASGQLALGIYDATGPNGGPGALKASTYLTPKTGWNTAKVVTPVLLAAGSYWLAYLPSSNALGFLKTNATGNCKYYSFKYNALPGKFSTSPASCNPTTWSFYATLVAATTVAVNGACGSSNGATLTSAPTANLCTTGTASTVSGSGPWSWSCAGSNGGTTATCSALKVASTQGVNGTCGSSNGATLTSAPTANLCTTGTASTITGSGPWRWNCAGSNGGTTASCSASLQAASSGSGSSASGPISFVALHTYYMSPTGSDSNNGTSPSTPWATPSHAVHCGDVIIAAAGSYADLQSFGTVSTCPSTSGGIDGTGGVYFATLLCGGASVGDCFITTKANTSGNTKAFDVSANNWAVEGWYVNTSGHGRAYEADGCGGVAHHIAFINDISANNLQATDTDDCGQSGSYGVDYFATVGVIAQNSAQDSICLAAIDVVGPGVFDTAAGTHYFVYGNFSYANANPGCRGTSDTEDYMADTWDYHNVKTQGIFADNIGFDSDRMCIQLFWQNNNADTPTIKIYNNTCFHNNNQTGADNYDGEINIASNQPSSTNIPWVITLQNNLAYQPLAKSGGGHNISAFAVYGAVSSLTNGGSGTQNFLRANNSSCGSSFCNSTFDAGSFGTSSELGTNTYTNPAYTNTTDLLANRVGVPSCTGFATTTACMGWNANTSTMTTASIISDLAPTASGTSGKGYQPPSTTCAANADFPTWLKGIVHLQWNGSGLTENSGLITKPCNM